MDTLVEAKDYGIKKSVASDLGQGASWGIVMATLGLGLWYGGKLVRDEDYEVHEMMGVRESLHSLCLPEIFCLQLKLQIFKFAALLSLWVFRLKL